ncbi:phospholipase D family protein [Novosphingobium guangzhouense]|uniref:Phospholipase D-like domain-containing protein n=1 Tax=Novosphingobium guangzhouense TaxID=1850347 RepID=A0A2K2FUB7_9SPHN|nr:phospholipase D family protein [Novosphingobium guangzhouense]PNU02366.1 hypothetical protein A8V01_26395 [Novosphingobium guangzhouense]
MKLQFLDASNVRSVLAELMDHHQEFHWAVAWGSLTGVATKLLKYPKKFRNVTFGVAFSQTDPNLVDELIGVAGAKVATKFSGGTYHPKVYGFVSGESAVAVVGSANFTFGGLGKNHEAAVLVEGNVSDPFFRDLLAFTRSSADLGEAVTADFAIAYRASCKRAARMPKPPHDPFEGLHKVKPSALSSSLTSMSWSNYVSEIQASQYHDVEDSIELLRVAQEWFASRRSFADLSLGQRQAIAGLVVDRNERNGADLARDWGWFGSMRGMGNFANLVIANDRHLAQAIDSVPQKGEVLRHHFKTFSRHFTRAFKGADRVGGYATASRLLAMKRPDVFLCVCKPNIAQAAGRMGFARTTLTLDDYWDKVIEIVRLSDWYNADKPDNAEGELWECRVALLDAVLYRPV